MAHQCYPACYCSTGSARDCVCSCGGRSHGKGSQPVPSASQDGTITAAKPPKATGRGDAVVHPSHEPIPGHPESVQFAAERRRLDERRDHMTRIRQQTDIVEFERMYWEQGTAHLELARRVRAAGGLVPPDAWGVRYVTGLPEHLAGIERDRRDVYTHIQGMRDSGEPDAPIISYLEGVYGGPFGGPTSSSG